MAEYAIFFVKYKNTLFVLIGIILLSIFVYLVRMLIKRNSKNREIQQAASDRIRNENLDRIILNPIKGDTKSQPKPYEVNYENGGEQDKRKENPIMVQMIENTELSSKKYILNPAKGIRIGSALEGNDIVIANGKLADYQCEIFTVKNKVYIKNLSNDIRTIIKRHKEQAIVDEKGIRILSGDRICIDKVFYDVTIVE